MKSQTTEKFRKAYQSLPVEIQQLAREAYRLWKNDPSHPSLHFKKVHDTKPIYSVRINLNYRTLGLKKDDTMIWFWIGSHAEYDRLLGLCCTNPEFPFTPDESINLDGVGHSEMSHSVQD